MNCLVLNPILAQKSEITYDMHLQHQPFIELAFKSLSFFTHSNPQRRRMENNNIYGFCRRVKLIINAIRQTSGVMRKKRLSWVRDETSVRGLGLTFSYLLQVFVAERLAYWDTQ